MAEKRQIAKCKVCGQMVEVVNAGAGELVCCGQPMELLTPNTVDASHEKHVPVIVSDGEKTVVRIGSAAHPMLDAHYIGWIELVCPTGVCRKELKPGDTPEAVFPVAYRDGMTARAWCNLHGLWEKSGK